MPDGAKPLPKPMLTYHLFGAVELISLNFVKGALDFSSQNEFEKIKPVKLLHLLEAIESMIDTTTIYTILVNTLRYVPLDIIENTQI